MFLKKIFVYNQLFFSQDKDFREIINNKVQVLQYHDNDYFIFWERVFYAKRFLFLPPLEFL